MKEMILETKGLNFHYTFKPERNCLSSMLTNLEECSGKTMEEIARVTGIPTGASSGKVAPTISYLEYMGLISVNLENKRYDLRYTELGKCVLDEDPGLIEELTLELLHCYIVRKQRGAELWSFIVCDLLPKYHGSINKNNFDKEIELRFGKEVKIAPFNGSYTGLLEQIGFLQISNTGYCIQPHTIRDDYIFLYGLILYEYWDSWALSYTDEEKDRNRISLTEITSEQLEATDYRQPFGWTLQEEYKVLEMLHDREIISLNRQMSPFSVRKICTREEIIELLYSELC